jgi:hypothetical protein
MHYMGVGFITVGVLLIGTSTTPNPGSDLQ